jgi:4-hydroxybenzoate polyprenyltransferase
MMKLLKNTRITLEMIKIEHTLLALPFALLGGVMAARGLPEGRTLFWVIVAMVGARSAAMAFNRLVDREFDQANPRTMRRAIPAGLLSVGFVRLFVVFSCVVFLLASAMLNRLTFLLAPVALVSILLYSYTKRFTVFSHFVLGWCLAMAPTGAWVAVRGAIDSPVPLLLSLGVLAWTTGFDILYSCQDAEFDKETGLRSIPEHLGIANAMLVAKLLHVVALSGFLGVAVVASVHVIGYVGILLTAFLLLRQHLIVRPNDLSKLNEAFFVTNAYISIILLLTMGGDMLILR